MTTAAILQPHYLPYPGFFNLIHSCDIFVFFDNVQFEPRSWQNRNKIKTPEGFKWLSVPVIKNFGQKIKDVKINNDINWQEKHWKAISRSYSKANFYGQYKDFLEQVFQKKWENLSELNIFIIKNIAEKLDLKTKFIKASELDVSGAKSELLANICKKINATHYISNIGSKVYMDKEMHFFNNANITVSYMDYKPPQYSQQFGEFMPFLSTIDLIFNHGEESKKIIIGGQ